MILHWNKSKICIFFKANWCDMALKQNKQTKKAEQQVKMWTLSLKPEVGVGQEIIGIKENYLWHETELYNSACYLVREKHEPVSQ